MCISYSVFAWARHIRFHYIFKDSLKVLVVTVTVTVTVTDYLF
jgi:hypothetical protein